MWVNGQRQGVMVRPGMTVGLIDEEGEPVGRLEGPLRWVVDMLASVPESIDPPGGHDASVAIDGPLPLPPAQT